MPILNCDIANLKEMCKHENEIKVEKNYQETNIYRDNHCCIMKENIRMYGILHLEISDSLFS